MTDGKADTYVYSQLAESYYNVFNTVEAEKWYAKALETASDPEMVYNYSQMLKANGKYEESNAQLGIFASMRPADHRATAFRDNPDYLPKILEKGKKFNDKILINSEFSDFGGTLEGGKLYITSARNSNRKTYGWNEEPFLDIYTANVNDEGEFQTPSIIEDNINTKYHEGTVSFSPDGNTMYFSRESFYEKIYERDPSTKYKISVLHIYKSVNQEGKWSEAEAIIYKWRQLLCEKPIR